MQARLDKERYQQALTEYQQRLTMSEAGLEESQGEEPYATYQPQRKHSPSSPPNASEPSELPALPLDGSTCPPGMCGSSA